MKKTTDGEAELISPPRGLSTWAEKASFTMSNPSPIRNILRKSTSRLLISGAGQVEAKRMTDGFLSEVSTPDCGSKNGQGGLSPEDKKEDQNTPKLSPHKPLPAACKESDVSDACKTVETTYPISNGEVIEGSRDPPCPSETPTSRHTSRHTSKEEKQQVISSEPEVPGGCETSSQVNGQQSTTTTLKRKCKLVNEEKFQRKRLKAGASERSRGKGSAQWSHLSEEELKKLRRVKNRESVEKCRTKQRLRMEALQVEQTCLRLENKKLREAMTLVHAAISDVSMQVTKIKTHTSNEAKADNGAKMKEMRKEVQA